MSGNSAMAKEVTTCDKGPTVGKKELVFGG